MRFHCTDAGRPYRVRDYYLFSYFQGGVYFLAAPNLIYSATNTHPCASPSIKLRHNGALNSPCMYSGCANVIDHSVAVCSICPKSGLPAPGSSILKLGAPAPPYVIS